MIRKTMAMTNIKLDRHFFIIAITQKLFAWFYWNFYPIIVMKFFISYYFLFLKFPHPQRKLFRLFHLVRVQRDPALPYICIMDCIMFVCTLHSLRNIAFWFYSSWLVKILDQRLPVTHNFTIIVYRDVKHL